MNRMVSMRKQAIMKRMFSMKIMAVLFILFALLTLKGGLALAEGTTIDYSGSLEVDGITQSLNSDFFLNGFLPGPSPLASLPLFGSHFKWQNDIRIVPNDQTTLKLRVSYLSDTVQTIVSNNDQFSLSRAFIDFTPGELFSIRAGKQRLAWGTGYAWNPSNILDQPRNAFADADDPEGVMAFRADLNFGKGATQVVITPGQSWDSSGRAVRLKASPGGVDLSLGVVQNGTQTPATIADFACSLSGVGLHGEVRYQSAGNIRLDKNDIMDYLIGVDYNLPGGYYVAVEYYHNDQAYKSVAELTAYLATIPHGTPEEMAAFYAYTMNYLNTLGNNGGVMQDHFFVRGMKKFGENATVELLLIYCPIDHSLVGQPKFEYVWGQNTSLFVKGLLASGDIGSEANILPAKSNWTLGMKVNF